jgi:predicted amidohydrolase
LYRSHQDDACPYLHAISPVPKTTVIIGLASPRIPTSLQDGLANVERHIADAAARGAEIVCFPEAYLPGLRGLDFDVPDFGAEDERRVVDRLARLTKAHAIAAIVGIEHVVGDNRQIAAAVFDANGELQGIQPKTQLDPAEERFYVPGSTRRVFEVNGVKFGIAICHEGWRYPETVRWAAMRGAKIVFHPQYTGGEREGIQLAHWLAPNAPYYEKAMMCRALENTIYFASVNYALAFPESATAVIGPTGDCEAFLPYGRDGVLIHEVDVSKATGLLASRYAPGRYQDSQTH